MRGVRPGGPAGADHDFDSRLARPADRELQSVLTAGPRARARVGVDTAESVIEADRLRHQPPRKRSHVPSECKYHRLNQPWPTTARAPAARNAASLPITSME